MLCSLFGALRPLLSHGEVTMRSRKGNIQSVYTKFCRSYESCKFWVRDAFCKRRREHRFLHAHPVRYNAALTLFPLLATSLVL